MDTSFKRPDGKTLNGYLAEPKAGKNAPGVVVIQEWWGLNDQIRGVADKLAGAGYRALVPDLYRGKSALEAKEAEHLMNGLNFADAAGQDVRGAVQYLKSTGSKKAGVTGFCMGGALTLLAAVNAPEADAAVAWYGFPPLEYVDASKIKAQERLAAAKAAHQRRRHDQIQRHDIRVIPHLDALRLLAEPAWEASLSFIRKNESHREKARFVPRNRRWISAAV